MNEYVLNDLVVVIQEKNIKSFFQTYSPYYAVSLSSEEDNMPMLTTRRCVGQKAALCLTMFLCLSVDNFFNNE